MTSVSPAGSARGFRELERLRAEGYEILEVDSDDTFVGIRLARDDARATILLTREDFRSLFPSFRPPLGLSAL